jgi:hypothetical protein
VHQLAGDSTFISIDCRRMTTNASLPPAQGTSDATVSDSPCRPDTSINRGFLVASFVVAGLQVASLIRHSITHHTPVMGLDHAARFVEFLVTFAIALSLQVVGSAFGLAAGSQKTACIAGNIVCFVFCILLAMIL